MEASYKRRRDDEDVDDAGFPMPAPLSRPRTAAAPGKGKGKAPVSALEALRSSQDDGPVVRYQPEGEDDDDDAGNRAAGPSTREQVLEALDTMDSVRARDKRSRGQVGGADGALAGCALSVPACAD